MTIIKRLVLGSGGLYGISILSAMNNIDISHVKTVVGCSVGAIIGFLFIIGYDPPDILQIVKDNIDKLRKLFDINIDKFFTSYGFINIFAIFIPILAPYIRDAGYDTYITLRQLKKLSRKELIICVTNINKCATEYFSAKTHPNLPAIYAILMSSCIPIVFEPVHYRSGLYVDGAISNAFPIDYLYMRGYKSEECMGIRLVMRVEKNNKDSDFISYMKDIIYSSISNNSRYLYNYPCIHIMQDSNIYNIEKELNIENIDRLYLSASDKNILNSQ
jgi:predicted acylesterase/phospholipase RssA